LAAPTTHPQRAGERRAAAAEGPLVEDAEQRVQDRGRAEEHLVQERDVGLGQHSRRLDLDHPLAQAAQIDRPEDSRSAR
jgi:hypothetical protein